MVPESVKRKTVLKSVKYMYIEVRNGCKGPGTGTLLGVAKISTMRKESSIQEVEGL